MSFSLYLRMSCPHCKAANWTYYGNSADDDTSRSCYAQALQCWSCKEAFWIDEESSSMEYEYMTKKHAVEMGEDPAEADYDDMAHILREYVPVEPGKESPV